MKVDDVRINAKPGTLCWREWQSFERQLQKGSQKLTTSYSLPNCKRAWESFECQLQQQPQSSQNDSHSNCLCPNCLEVEACQETTALAAKI